MASFRLLPFFFAIAAMGWSPAVAQDVSESGAVSSVVREPRSPHHRRKLCRKYGICEGQGGFQGGQQGYYGGYQGGYPQQGYPPINIAISQSQSSANEAGGGYSNGYYPNNYQYNGGYPNQGYPNHGHNYGGHGGYGGGYGGYQKPGYFGNGQGAYNNQFNGNYHGVLGGNPHGGGYGFQGPVGGFYDEGANDQAHGSEQDEDSNQTSGPEGYGGYQGRSNEGGQQNNNFAAAASIAVAGRKPQ